MSIIDRYALHLAHSIRRNNPAAASAEVLQFSLIIIINTVSVILSVLLVTLLTGHFMQGAIVLFGFALLRFFSGGVHLSSSVSCTIISSVVLILIAHVIIPTYLYTGLILDLFSILILLVTHNDKSTFKFKNKTYPLMKFISVAIVCSNFLVQSSLLSIVFLTQALTLTKFVYRLVKYIERRKPNEEISS
ncbi:putative regulator protein [compost metagenome]